MSNATQTRAELLRNLADREIKLVKDYNRFVRMHVVAMLALAGVTAEKLNEKDGMGTKYNDAEKSDFLAIFPTNAQGEWNGLSKRERADKASKGTWKHAQTAVIASGMNILAVRLSHARTLATAKLNGDAEVAAWLTNEKIEYSPIYARLSKPAKDEPKSETPKPATEQPAASAPETKVDDTPKSPAQKRADYRAKLAAVVAEGIADFGAADVLAMLTELASEHKVAPAKAA